MTVLTLNNLECLVYVGKVFLQILTQDQVIEDPVGEEDPEAELFEVVPGELPQEVFRRRKVSNQDVPLLGQKFGSGR